jgi:hypothetical protein
VFSYFSLLISTDTTVILPSFFAPLFAQKNCKNLYTIGGT